MLNFTRSTLTLQGMTPRCRALARAAQMAAETASNSRDARHALEAEAIKRELERELERSQAAPPSEPGEATKLGTW
jgi:hypothetical protein